MRDAQDDLVQFLEDDLSVLLISHCEIIDGFAQNCLPCERAPGTCTYFVLAPECLGKMINTYADGKLVAYNTAVAYPIGIVFAIAMLAIFIYATKKHTASQKA